MNTFETIKNEILRGDYKENCRRNRWAGAGAVFTDDPNDRLFNDPSVVVAYSAHSREIIWLVEILKKIANVDYMSKYEFYPKLAVAVNDYRKTHGDDNVEDLLIFVLDIAKPYLQ